MISFFQSHFTSNTLTFKSLRLEKEMATHYSITAWDIQWTEEPGGLQPRVARSQTGMIEHAHQEIL